jgi:hypothetical protein
MTNILLQIVADTNHSALKTKSSAPIQSNIWFWTTIVELAIIIFLIVKHKRQAKINYDSNMENALMNSKTANVDMDNVMDSINKSRDLYKQLSTKCHPDRFLDKDLNNKANEIFQEITKNQRNYKKLLELKETAQIQLNITI